MLAQVLPHPQLIFPFKTWFFGIYLNFQRQKSLLNQYLPHSESKPYQINSIKSCSSRSFQQHQRHIHSSSSEIFSYYLIWFSMKKSFNIQELLHLESKRHGTQPMHSSSSSRAFQRHQEHDLKHPGLVDLITTKQKQTTFLHRSMSEDGRMNNTACWMW